MVGNIAMRQAILIAVALSCFVVVGEARSSEMTLTGADLLKACTVADHEWIGFCNGYIQAAFDATGGKGICAPRGVTRNQLFDIIIPKLKHAPDLLEQRRFSYRCHPSEGVSLQLGWVNTAAGSALRWVNLPNALSPQRVPFGLARARL